MASFLLIGLAVMAAVLVVRWLMRRSAQQPAAPVSAAATAYTPLSQAPSWSLAGMTGGTAAGPTAAPVATAATFPPGFDEAAFVRVAKVNFIRLQDASDRGDLEDLRAFTTPELFAEIRMQLSERGAAPNHTDVVELRAAVVDYAQESARDVASVRFSGLIREAKDAPAVAFDETWHLIQPRDGSSGWLVAGIQQNS
jgi:predicted lipid-binding transport protein (Tim44 family)